MTDLEWITVTSNRAEQIAQLARYATIEAPTLYQLQQQQSQIKALYITVEHVQNKVFEYQGNHYMWTEAQAARNFSNALLRLPMPYRKLNELDILEAKRKETIKDIVHHLTEIITRVSIELERQKLVALAHISREISLLISLKHEAEQVQHRNYQQVAQEPQRTVEYNQPNYGHNPQDRRTNTFN